MTTERNIQALIMLRASKIDGCVLWRNNRGRGWVGKLVRIVRGALNQVTLSNARQTSFGLSPGASDLIGMYNGRFLAVEVKRPGEKPTIVQAHFITFVRAMRGTAFVATSADDFEAKLPKPLCPITQK